MTRLDIVNETTARHHLHATEFPSHEETKRCSRYGVAISGADYNRIAEQVEAKEEAPFGAPRLSSDEIDRLFCDVGRGGAACRLDKVHRA